MKQEYNINSRQSLNFISANSYLRALLLLLLKQFLLVQCYVQIFAWASFVQPCEVLSHVFVKMIADLTFLF